MPHRNWRFRHSEFIPKRHNSESILQEMVVRWLDQRNILYVASLMGVNLGARVGAIRKRMGCRAGVPDLLILEARGKYHGMALELKVAGGKITGEQKAFKKELETRGYYAVIMPPKLEVGEVFAWAIKDIEYYLKSPNLRMKGE